MSQPTSAAITIAAMPAPATINRQRPEEGLDGPLRFQDCSQPLPPSDPDGPPGLDGPPGPDGSAGPPGPVCPLWPLGQAAFGPLPRAPPEGGFSGSQRTGSRSEPRTGCGFAAAAVALSPTGRAMSWIASPGSVTSGIDSSAKTGGARNA